MSVHTTSLAVARQFFDSLESGDVDAIGALLADDVVQVLPLSFTGDPEPGYTFTGKQEVLGYLGSIPQRFSRRVITDQRYTVSADGDVVFFEGNGDLAHAGTGAPYRNVYVFKFELAGG